MFLNGITIVLCGNQDHFEGATIAWATRIERRHVLVSLPSHAAVTQLILEQAFYTVSVLGAHQPDIPRQYGGRQQARPLPRDPKDLDFEHWPVPIVKGCRASYLLQQVETLVYNEQTVVIGAIQNMQEFSEVEPLIYKHAAYFDD